MQVQTGLSSAEAAAARAHAVAAGMLLRPYQTVTPVHQAYSSAVTGGGEEEAQNARDRRQLCQQGLWDGGNDC